MSLCMWRVTEIKRVADKGPLGASRHCTSVAKVIGVDEESWAHQELASKFRWCVYQFLYSNHCCYRKIAVLGY